ncbi:MAG: DUF2975 domain-containing protein [Clostridia bacterium]|nr:DUF2975 domain-containing protein [Clostridia bacterium]
MNTNVKTKINRLGLVGVIISILLIVSTLVTFALVTNRSVQNIRSNHTGAYYGDYDSLEMESLSILAAEQDNAVKIETEDGITYMLPLGPSEEDGTFTYSIKDGAYEILYPLSENSSYSFTVEDPEGALAKARAQVIFNDATSILQIVSAAFSVVVFVFLLLAADAFRRCDSPFEDRVIRRMNVFAWVLLASALFNLFLSLFSEIGGRIFYENIAGYYTANGIVESVLYLVTPSFPLVVSLIVLFLVRVFRHGAELQKESDETL